MKHIYTISLFFFILLVSTASLDAQSRSGTYNRKDKWGSGNLVITTGKSSVNFKLNVGRTGKTMFEKCVGEMKGRAQWVSEYIAEYNGDYNERDEEGEAIGCRLTFIFSANTVTIREGDCNDYHGAMCNFEGNYSRPVRKPRKTSPKLPKSVITV